MSLINPEQYGLSKEQAKDIESFFNAFNEAIHELGYFKFEFQLFTPSFKDSEYIIKIPIKIFYSTKDEFLDYMKRLKEKFIEKIPKNMVGDLLLRCISHYNFEITLVIH